MHGCDPLVTSSATDQKHIIGVVIRLNPVYQTLKRFPLPFQEMMPQGAQPIQPDLSWSNTTPPTTCTAEAATYSTATWAGIGNQSQSPRTYEPAAGQQLAATTTPPF